MPAPRSLPLFDPGAEPASWNERMQPGEFAVHYSHYNNTSTSGPVCTVFDSLASAENYVNEQVKLDPTLRCRIYDHQGLIGAPIAEVRGQKFVASEISPRFRRWGGSILFFGGLLLTLIDWAADFKFGWPAMLGTRMMIPGFILLFTEAMILLHAKYDSRPHRRSAA